jgi:hypothetical protein
MEDFPNRSDPLRLERARHSFLISDGVTEAEDSSENF